MSIISNLTALWKCSVIYQCGVVEYWDQRTHICKNFLNVMLCYALSTVIKCQNEPSNTTKSKGEVSFNRSLTSPFSASHKNTDPIYPLSQCCPSAFSTYTRQLHQVRVWQEFGCTSVPFPCCALSCCCPFCLSQTSFPCMAVSSHEWSQGQATIRRKQ